MGDFFNEVVIFLEDNYVYVIGVGLIIILMLIGLIASKRKARKAPKAEGTTMANINDVSTGSINDVANTIQNNSMQPVDVVAAPVNNNMVENAAQPVANNIVSEAPASPVTPVVAPTPTPENVVVEPITPIQPEVSNPVANDTSINAPFGTIQPNFQETKPVEENFDKTEVIDLTGINPEKPIDINNNITPFVSEPSQFSTPTDILNGESSNNEAPKV